MPCSDGLLAVFREGAHADFVAFGIHNPLQRALDHQTAVYIPCTCRWRHITVVFDKSREHKVELQQLERRLNVLFNWVDFAFSLKINGSFGAVCGCNFLIRHIAALRADICSKYPAIQFCEHLHVKLY